MYFARQTVFMQMQEHFSTTQQDITCSALLPCCVALQRCSVCLFVGCVALSVALSVASVFLAQVNNSQHNM